MNDPLSHRLRDLRFQHRLDQASLVAAHGDETERARAAAAIIREIAMQRVFDRLTKAQERELLDRLWPLANAGGVSLPPIFSHGCRSTTDRPDDP